MNFSLCGVQSCKFWEGLHVLSGLTSSAGGGQDSFWAGVGAFLDSCHLGDAGATVSSQPWAQSLLG